MPAPPLPRAGPALAKRKKRRVRERATNAAIYRPPYDQSVNPEEFVCSVRGLWVADQMRVDVRAVVGCGLRAIGSHILFASLSRHDTSIVTAEQDCHELTTFRPPSLRRRHPLWRLDRGLVT